MRALALLALLAAPALGWEAMEAPAALAGRTIDYEGGARQRFAPSGATLYDAGEPSWGRWEIREGRYCSRWPPAEDWACYGAEVDGAGGLRFVGGRGRFTAGTFRG